jgi:hypothetical protein
MACAANIIAQHGDYAVNSLKIPVLRKKTGKLHIKQLSVRHHRFTPPFTTITYPSTATELNANKPLENFLF